MSTLLQGKPTAKVVEEISRLSGDRLQFEEEISMLLNLANTPEKEKELESLTFTAKYCLGLMRVIRRGTGNPEISNLNQIKSDLNSNLQKVRDQLSTFVRYADNDFVESFNKKFLSMDTSAFAIFITFLESLEWMKLYFNTLKRSEL